MGLTRFERDVRAALVGLSANPEAPTWGNPDWTREVKAAVGRVAKNAGHDWLPSDAAAAWLCDGTAQKRRDGALIDIPLMLESEWGGWDAIRYDFEKLMVVRAKYRVMVCSAYTPSGAEETLTKLKSIVQSFQAGQRADRYFLACWFGPAGTAGEFTFRSHVVGD